MANTQDILGNGFKASESKGNILEALFDKEKLPELATQFDAHGLDLTAVLGAGQNTIVFQNKKEDAVRVDSTFAGIDAASLSESIVLQKVAEFVFADLKVRASVYRALLST